MPTEIPVIAIIIEWREPSRIVAMIYEYNFGSTSHSVISSDVDLYSYLNQNLFTYDHLFKRRLIGKMERKKRISSSPSSPIHRIMRRCRIAKKGVNRNSNHILINLIFILNV